MLFERHHADNDILIHTSVALWFPYKSLNKLREQARKHDMAAIAEGNRSKGN
jgi:hypothetical protein